MTLRKTGYVPVYTGLEADEKPSMAHDSTGYIPVGTEFVALDSGKKSVFDGGGTWYSAQNKSYYLDGRASVAITTTSSHLYAGTAMTKYGDLMRQYTITLGASTNTPTRTMSILDSNSVQVWASTAISGTTAATSITRLLPTSEQVIFDGVYSVVWTLSTNSATTGIYDYYTLGFDRG